MRQYEEAEQVTIMSWAELNKQKYPELKWLHHIPNGGHRHKATAARLKAAGVKRADKKGRATEHQKKWLAYLSMAGYKAALCHGYEEAVGEIERYLKIEKL